MPGDAYSELVAQLLALVREHGAAPAFRLGTVRQAGGGRLRVSCGGLALEREDLYVHAGLDWRWTEDTGGAELLRPGDLVILLTGDDQTYYLICKVVSAA